jgi:asparagine synthase (glutamine-hydrolysing)
VKSFLGVTVGPAAAPRLRRPVEAALTCLTDDDTTIEHLDVTQSGWVALAGGDAQDLFGDPDGSFTVPLGRLMRTRAADVATADVARMLLRGAGLEEMLPPFAAAHRATSDEPVIVATDWLGFRQLFWWRGNGVAGLSTSARALSVLAGGAFDDAGIGAQAMIGWQVGDRTPFSGVYALPAAAIAKLYDGKLELRRYAPPLTAVSPVPRLDDAVEEMADILRGFQSRYLEAHPRTVLQLTGGIDSRILLGAIRPEQRQGLGALTLGEETHPDVVIASRLAKKYGMRHETHRLDEVVPTPVEAHELGVTASRALECQASPMALAPLLLVESHLDQGHRLSGLGGEVARGFYYAGQPADTPTSAQLVNRLAEWRIFANEAVEPDALEPSFAAEAREGTLSALRALFEPGDWLRATDAFYLYQRMHRWAGAHGTVAAVRRHAVNPMFDRRFIELALAVAPADKKDSMLLGRLMTTLDPELAGIPIDSGLVPSRLGTRDFRTRVAIAKVTARRMAVKVGQKLTHGRRPQLGAAATAELVLMHWRTSPSSCAALYEVSMLNRPWVEGLVRGSHDAAPTTIAFLVNVLAAVTPDDAQYHSASDAT